MPRPTRIYRLAVAVSWLSIVLLGARLDASQHPLAFVCGPTSFVETAADNLIGLGYPPERVKTERFGGT